jgi:NAD-dependent deacetylase
MAELEAISPKLVSLLRVASRVVVLTGAGVSQESWLHTFRDAQVGLWAQYRPEDLATPEAFAKNPKLVWDWYALRREQVKTVAPNPGHYALAEMARQVPKFTLITQNVDGLHQRAGNVEVIELHGSLRRVKCAACGQPTHEWAQTETETPRCAACGGLLRPDVVWFGEELPHEALAAAVEAARFADIFFSIGTSGLVQPAASLAMAAKHKNALVVEVNAEPTALSKEADFVLIGKSGEILPALVQAVWGGGQT